MKPSNNKEQQKIFLVVGLTVAMVAVVGYNLFGSQGSAAPAPAPSASASPDAGAAGVGGGGGSTAAAAAGGATAGAADTAAAAILFDPSKIPLVTSGRDPFVPNGPASLGLPGAPPPAPAPSSAPKYIPNVPLNKEIGGSIRALTARSVGDVDGGGAPAQPGGGMPLTPPDPVPPAYALTGVVLGEKGGRDVAILRGGQEERKFVTVGEDVGNGFYVAAIRADGVILKNRKASLEPVTLPLGRSE